MPSAGDHSGLLDTTPSGSVGVPAHQPLPELIEKALDEVSDPQARKALSIAISRTSSTSFGIVGPDPETAKILSQAEMHEEECKLKAFQASLDNREKQGQRDHEFRKKKLNHSTCMSIGLIGTSICGVGVGLYLTATGNTAVGNPVMIAGFAILSPFAGKLLASRDKD